MVLSPASGAGAEDCAVLRGLRQHSRALGGGSPPKFKGHKSEAARPIRRAEVAQKMAEMPKLIAEYMRERREKRAKERANSRWK